jgi:hypothetical protein
MKNLLRKYPQAALVTLALLLLAIIIAYYVWGIGDVVTAVNQAVNDKVSAGKTTGFDLQDAKNLNLRGLVSQ